MLHDDEGTISLSRRSLLAGAAGTLALATTVRAFAADGGKGDDVAADLAILQAAHDLENQGIWAYQTAAGKLSKTDVGKTILALALRNQADHKEHKRILAGAIESLGAKPSPAKESYDLSSYLKAKEGGLDSDANIAKLALALEVDAALAYMGAVAKLKNPALAAAANTLLPAEAGHAVAIRAVFRTLMPTVEYVPGAALSAQNRKDWVMKV
jgi:rubrerythrin